MELSNQQREICELLLEKHINESRIRKNMEDLRLSAEDINKIGIEYVQNYEILTEEVELREWDMPPICKVIQLLLEYGLDPNAVVDSTNIMHELKYVSIGYVGADALNLLLEAGGRWDLIVEDESLFDVVDFDVIFDSINQKIRHRFDALVHFWLVLVGHGAKTNKGEVPVEIFIYSDETFDTVDFKNHWNYTWGLTNISSRGEDWTLHIFDKKSGWERARV